MNEITSREHITLTIAGADVDVVTMGGREALSELFVFNCVCRSVVGVEPRTLIGAPAALVLGRAATVHRTIDGVVASAANTMSDHGSAILRVTIRPSVFRHTLGRDSRVFLHKDVPTIVKEVLGDTMRTRWNLSETYEARDYTAQYREDDWRFVSRLLEEEGIFYWFDDDADGSILVFDDDSTGATPIAMPIIAYAEETGRTASEEYVHELGSLVQAGSTLFTVGSFNEQNPQLSVTGAAGNPGREMYDAPGGGPITSSVCERRARVRSQCANAMRQRVLGRTPTMRLCTGRTITIAGHPHLDNDYLIVAINHEAVQRRAFGGEGELGYRCAFEAQPAVVPYRHPEVTPVAKQAGLQSGRVVGPPGEEIHTDNRGRVRAQMHWDRQGGWDDKAGKWVRVAQRGVASSMLLPRQGWNVIMFMEEGATDAPTILSRVHDADHPPTYPLPDNKTRTVFRTMSSPANGSFNEISFEDLAGAQEMFLNASRDMNYRVNESYDDMVHNNQTKSVGGNQEITVGRVRTEKVKNDQDFSVGGDEKVDVGKGRVIGVSGNDTVSVGGNREIESKSTMDIVTIGKRKLEVGGNGEEKVSGNYGMRTGKTQWKVGGNLERKSELALVQNTSEHHIEVGGSVTEKAKSNIGLLVNLDYTEKIGGNLTVQTEDAYVEGADKKFKWDVTRTIEGKAPHVHIEAEKLIELAVGLSTLSIDETSVTLVAPKYDLSDAPEMESDGAIIKQN